MKRYKVRYYLSYEKKVIASNEEEARQIILKSNFNKPVVFKVYPMNNNHCLNCDEEFSNLYDRTKFCSDKCRHAHYYKTTRKFNSEQNKEVIREYNRKYYHTVRKLKREELRKCN